MSGEIVRGGGSSLASEVGLLGSSARSRNDLDSAASLLSVIVSRKLNTTNDIRIDPPPARKLTPISSNERLT